MNIDSLSTTNPLCDYLEGTHSPVDFNANATWDERYSFIQRTLVKFSCPGPPATSVVIRYPLKVSRYSHQQLDRLVAQYRNTGRLDHRHSAGNGFARK